MKKTKQRIILDRKTVKKLEKMKQSKPKETRKKGEHEEETYDNVVDRLLKSWFCESSPQDKTPKNKKSLKQPLDKNLRV